MRTIGYDGDFNGDFNYNAGWSLWISRFPSVFQFVRREKKVMTYSRTKILLVICWSAIVGQNAVAQESGVAEETVYSGPQVGEKLPSLTARGVWGEEANKDFDFIADANGKPVVLLFFHKRTRPAFGLMNTIMRFVESKTQDKLRGAVVFLTDDPIAEEQWLNNVRRHLAKGVSYGISKDGLDGPGAYGLNRDVTVTVLVGKDGVTTANYALVQPSMQADGPKILKSIVDVVGGEVPKLADLQPAMQRRRMNRARPGDPKLATLLRPVINKQATPEAVVAAAKAVDEYVSQNQKAAQELGRIANRIVRSGRLATYGTEPAQQQIKEWSEKYRPNRAPIESPEQNRPE